MKIITATESDASSPRYDRALLASFPYCAVRLHACILPQTGRLEVSAMVGRLHGAVHMGRQLVAAALIFALLWQGVAFAFATWRHPTTAAADIDQAGFELCLYDTGGADRAGGTPERPATDQHCILCLASATYVLGAPAWASAFRTIAFATVSWPFVAWRLPATTVDASARPRGPPSTV